MDGQAELDSRIARLQAALGATARALEAAKARAVSPPDDSELRDAQAATEAAKAEADRLRIARDAAESETQTARDEAEALRAKLVQIEAEAAARPDPASEPVAAPNEADAVRMRAALEAMQAASADLRAQTPGAVDASLRAENDALRAARAMDLAEMQALLAELEPMLEASNA